MPRQTRRSGGGPQTAAGKRRSSSNALRHGQTASTLIAEIMGEERFAETLANLRADLAPQGEIEEALIQEVAQSLLSLELNHIQFRAVCRRITGFAQTLQDHQNAQRQEVVDAVMQMLLESVPFGLARRYGTAAAGRLGRALHQLWELQRRRFERTSITVHSQRTADSEIFQDIADLCSDERRLRDFLLDARQRFGEESAKAPASPHQAVPLRREWHGIELQGSFLAATSLPPAKAVLAAAMFVMAPTSSIAAFSTRSGIRRRQTIKRLLPLLRSADGTQRDWCLSALREMFLNSS